MAPLRKPSALRTAITMTPSTMAYSAMVWPRSSDTRERRFIAAPSPLRMVVRAPERGSERARTTQIPELRQDAADLVERVADTAGEELQRGEDRHRDHREDNCVLGHGLAVLTLHLR